MSLSIDVFDAPSGLLRKSPAVVDQVIGSPGVHRVRGFATGLAGLGVASGDRVAIVLRNDPAFLEITMAAGLLDTLPVPVNWHWHGAELGHLLTGSRVVFEDLTGVVREAPPPGVPLVEVPVPPELYEAYGLVARGAGGGVPR